MNYPSSNSHFDDDNRKVFQKIKSSFIVVVLYLWQLPQHLLALLLWVLLRLSGRVVWVEEAAKPLYITIKVKTWGVSLGWYIFLDEAYGEKARLHEQGHSRQSQYLGPLYLLVVGIPSAVFNNLWDRWFHKNWTNQKRITWYYNRFPEHWADKLGGVERF